MGFISGFWVAAPGLKDSQDFLILFIYIEKQGE